MANGHTNGWSTDREDRLRALVLDGLTATRIGVEIGLSRGAVIGKIDRLGLRLLGGPGRPGRRPGPQKPRKSRARKPKVTTAVILAPPPDGGIDLAAKPKGTTAVILAPPPGEGVDILALAAGVCRWPQDTIEGVRYCGGETYPRHVYCPAHHRLAFSPT